MSKSSVVGDDDDDGDGDPNIILTVICECRGLFQHSKWNWHEIVFPPAVTQQKIIKNKAKTLPSQPNDVIEYYENICLCNDL